MSTRSLIVTGIREIKRGKSERGREWRLYEVRAETAGGDPIRAPLRTFERLPTGELLQVEIERGPSDTWTLRRRRRRGGSSTAALAQDLGDLRDLQLELEGRVDQLEQDVREPRLPLSAG